MLIFACMELDYLILAQAAPVLDGAFALRVVLRVLHIASAVILVGGLFYQRSVLSSLEPEARFGGNRQVWARWVGLTSLFLLATGIYNFMAILMAAKDAGTPLPSTYHALFGVKFLLGLTVMFFAAVLSGKTPVAQRFRLQMGKWLNVTWSVALTIIILAAVLRSLH
jgi:hypothetical protein